MKKRSRKRTKKRFVYDQKRGKISAQGSQQTLERQSAQTVVPTRLADALLETSRVVGPLVEEWHIPPIEAVMLVVQGVHSLLVGESEREEPPKEALTSLTVTILHFWEQGSLHMEASFPYTFSQFDQAWRAGEMERTSEKLTLPDSWLKLGSRALAEHSYILACVFFSQAGGIDEDWETAALFWYGVACLHCNRIEEAREALDTDAFERENSLASHLLLEWLHMGDAPTRLAYLEALCDRWSGFAEDDPLELFSDLGDESSGHAIYLIYCAIEDYLRGDFQSSLDKFTAVRAQGERDYLWMIGFWEALDYASLDQLEQAHRSLQEALDYPIPAILLLPSRWLRETRPDAFDRLFRPQLVKHSLLASTESEVPRESETSLASQGRAVPMSRLFESYIEARLLQNEELYKQARQRRDTYAQQATVVGRVLLEIVHARMLILDVDRSVMDLVFEKIQAGKQDGDLLPQQALHPVPPPQPLLIDFLAARVARRDWGLPPIAGMALVCTSDPDVVRAAKALLPVKYHDILEGKRNAATEKWAKIPGVKLQPITYTLQPWQLRCLDEWGEEILTYQYMYYDGEWDWQFDGRHPCPYGKCHYTPIGTLEKPCTNCWRDLNVMALYVGFILLYDSGYYQEVIVREEAETRTYSINLDGGTPKESETTRPVKIRRLRKNVLVKELVERKPVENPRGSWMAKHAPDEIVVLEKVRRRYHTRTRSGKVIEVVPTQPRKTPMLKINVLANTEVELYAQSPTPNTITQEGANGSAIG